MFRMCAYPNLYITYIYIYIYAHLYISTYVCRVRTDALHSTHSFWNDFTSYASLVKKVPDETLNPKPLNPKP